MSEIFNFNLASSNTLSIFAASPLRELGQQGLASRARLMVENIKEVKVRSRT